MLLAIDCGSTNHKVALFDERLDRRAICSEPVRYTVRNAERVEFDPEWIWNTTLSLIRKACKNASIPPSEINTIALASQAQTFTLLDPSGKAVMPFISWADKRATNESAQVASQLGDVFRFHCSFPTPLPQLEISKLLWTSRHYPDWFSSNKRVAALPSFLALRLAGLHITDNNLAAMSGLYSCRENDFWSAALNCCGVDRQQLGELVTIGQSISAADTCSELSFAQDLRLVCAGNDQTAGAFGNGCRSGKTVLTLGTALVVYRYVGDSPGPFQNAGCWGPYPGGGFYELAACDEGCAALDWAVEQMMPGNETRFFEIASSAVPGTTLFFPQRMHHADAWQGKSDSVASLARAVLEGICFRARQMLQQELNLTLESAPLCVVGGGSQSRFWLEILANVLDYPVCQGEGDILLGAAMIARPETTPPLDARSRVIEPTSATAAQYDDQYHCWLERSQHLAS
jgi:xylulokinase